MVITNMRKRKPEPTWKDRKADARRFDHRMRKFAIRKDGHSKLSDDVLRDILDRSNGNLRSASIPARIAFARAARRSARKLLHIGPRSPAFMVTLVPRQFALPFSDALLFDWSAVEEWTSEVLAGLDHFGMIEVSYFTEHPMPGVREPVCHFHAHAIVWNVTRRELGAVEARINRDYSAFLPGGRCMDVRGLRSIERVRTKLAYILKPLMRDYRSAPSKDGPEAGWQRPNKREFRSGEAAKALRLLQGIDIDALCIAGGEGRALLRETAQRARNELAEREEGLRARLAKMVG